MLFLNKSSGKRDDVVIRLEKVYFSYHMRIFENIHVKAKVFYKTTEIKNKQK